MSEHFPADNEQTRCCYKYDDESRCGARRDTHSFCQRHASLIRKESEQESKCAPKYCFSKANGADVCETWCGRVCCEEGKRPDCQPSATETPSVRRWHVTSRHDIDDVNTRCDEVMVNAADFAALEKQRDELRTQLAAAQAALRKYGRHEERCALRYSSIRGEWVGRVGPCICGFNAALSPATGDAK